MLRSHELHRSRSIQQRTGRTFHLATRLLPKRYRHPTYVLYAFFRVADEVVDCENPGPPAEQTAELEGLRAEAVGDAEPSGPVLAAFQRMREEHDIPADEVETFVDAMQSDVETRRYETYDDLETYMRGSAAAVGAMMTAVFDPDDPETALPHAIALGEAFQLTNFLRDVREDVVERDRVYLPAETLERHGASVEDVLALESTPGVCAAIRDELGRAESLYREGVAGIQHLPADAQLPVLAAAVLYADHHRLIRACDYDTVSNEPSLGFARSLRLVAETRWRWQWNRDPEAVFERVSAIGPAGDDAHADAGWCDHLPV
jgi:phytoene synthase